MSGADGVQAVLHFYALTDIRLLKTARVPQDHLIEVLGQDPELLRGLKFEFFLLTVAVIQKVVFGAFLAVTSLVVTTVGLGGALLATLLVHGQKILASASLTAAGGAVVVAVLDEGGDFFAFGAFDVEILAAEVAGSRTGVVKAVGDERACVDRQTLAVLDVEVKVLLAGVTTPQCVHLLAVLDGRLLADLILSENVELGGVTEYAFVFGGAF